MPFVDTKRVGSYLTPFKDLGFDVLLTTNFFVSAMLASGKMANP